MWSQSMMLWKNSPNLNWFRPHFYVRNVKNKVSPNDSLILTNVLLCWPYNWIDSIRIWQNILGVSHLTMNSIYLPFMNKQSEEKILYELFAVVVQHWWKFVESGHNEALIKNLCWSMVFDEWSQSRTTNKIKDVIFYNNLSKFYSHFFLGIAF